ncbi:hypothetical protein BCR33DRAFT_713425 [Rhizoclosmatium globosum]|uniref:Centrosomal protein 43 n=1 Tax=Rhizoclosmatium globosum TaxID=329046 RepID=A0A1Y2CRZ1_9FUNG|nr:hypothetical protein BCR33DRAFT_713425 [Rhizoclosmatium globosum]|eukprot:ORY49819.1 hypothetical protein BCR33DRAFT_713425 [Rhizoclosmatium globosum]
MAATFDDLKQALAQNLESRGILGSVKAKLRAEIFKSLNEDLDMPAHAFETDVMNELIVEYLEFHGFKNTCSVFNAEANIKKPLLPRSRSDICTDLHVDDRAFPADIPLLYPLCFKNLPPEPLPDRVLEPTSRKQENAGIGASDSDFARNQAREKTSMGTTTSQTTSTSNCTMSQDGSFDMGYVELTNARRVEKGVGTN